MESAEAQARIERELREETFIAYGEPLFDSLDSSDHSATPRGRVSASHTFTRRQHAKAVSGVMDMVNAARRDDDVPIVQKLVGQRLDYDLSRLATMHYPSIGKYLDTTRRLPTGYAYDEYIQAFIESCRALGIYDQQLSWAGTWHSGAVDTFHHDTPRCTELFNALVQRLRAACRGSHITATRRLRLREINARFKDNVGYCDALFNRWARLIVIRVDLYYPRRFFRTAMLETAKEDWAHFLNNRRSQQSIFRAMRGYLWKLEYAVQKGPHIHCLFFFDGSIRRPQSHIHLAEDIGEYWKHVVTKGRGRYWNINRYAKRYEILGRRGIGDIHRSDALAIHNLKQYVIGYLCKSEQYVRPLIGKPYRLMGRGVIKPSSPARCSRCSS